MQERLQKILSRAGFASRRGAEKVMAEGRLTVNGEVVRTLGTKADLGQDDIRVDGVRVPAPKSPVYLLLYKPKGIVTTRHDPEGRQTVMDLVPPVAGLFPVGRLDVTTEGVILMTNDGAFAERVSHPRYEVPRVYHAKVHRIPDAETLARLRAGVRVEGTRMAVDDVRVIEQGHNSWLEVTLHEGKHHEVKRLLEAVGHQVSKLKRVAVGPLTLRGLKPGEFRALLPQEVRILSSDAARRPAARPPVAHPLAGGRRERPRDPKQGRPAFAGADARRPVSAMAGSGRTTPLATISRRSTPADTGFRRPPPVVDTTDRRPASVGAASFRRPAPAGKGFRRPAPVVDTTDRRPASAGAASFRRPAPAGKGFRRPAPVVDTTDRRPASAGAASFRRPAPAGKGFRRPAPVVDTTDRRPASAGAASFRRPAGQEAATRRGQAHSGTTSRRPGFTGTGHHRRPASAGRTTGRGRRA